MPGADSDQALLLPAYGADSLSAILPAVARSFGVVLPAECPMLTSPTCQLPPVTNVIIVLCDGLGWHNLQSRKGHAPYLRSRLPEFEILTTTFPSTTAAAIVAFGTGSTPGQTGFVGYTVRNPSNGALVNLVPWTEVIDPTVIATPVGNTKSPTFKMPPLEFQTQTQIFTYLIDQGVVVSCVGGAKYAGSQLSTAAFGKTNYVVAEKPDTRVDAVLKQLKKTDVPQVIYLYWGELDKTGHQFGPNSAEYGDALTDFDAEFARLVAKAPPGTLVILTADHGQVEPNPAQQMDVATVPALSQGVTLVAGEARAAHVYLAAGTDPEAAKQRWQSHLADLAWVWTRSEAIALNLFGPTKTQVEPWIGNLVVTAKGQATIVDSRTQTTNSLTLKGVHGSLTETEMQIPLLITVT